MHVGDTLFYQVWNKWTDKFSEIEYDLLDGLEWCYQEILFVMVVC